MAFYFNQLMYFVLDRLGEPSSWRGLSMLATALGVAISPETMEEIVVAGTAMVGLIGTFSSDDRRR